MPNKGRYYMPQGVHEFLDWSRNFIEVGGANAVSWGLVQADLDALKAKSDDLAQKLEKALSDEAAKADIRAKNTALHETQTAFRDYVNEKIRHNRKIDHDGRAALRVNVPDAIKTAIPPPKTRVEFTVKPVNEREHRIDYWDEASGKKAVPYGYTGVILFKKLLEPNEAAPIDPAALPESKLLTGSPYIEEFLPSAQGLRAAYSACWQNEKGERGPVSDVQVHVIP